MTPFFSGSLLIPPFSGSGGLLFSWSFHWVIKIEYKTPGRVVFFALGLPFSVHCFLFQLRLFFRGLPAGVPQKEPSTSMIFGAKGVFLSSPVRTLFPVSDEGRPIVKSPFFLLKCPPLFHPFSPPRFSVRFATFFFQSSFSIESSDCHNRVY